MKGARSDGGADPSGGPDGSPSAVPAKTFTAHRTTSNSRGPGQRGMPVTIATSVIHVCPLCRGLRYGDGPHSPHWVRQDDAMVRVDCCNNPIPGEANASRNS